MTGQDVAATINAFKSGRSSVLVASSVIEEGYDVPHANVVALILYDHIQDSVDELCQRFGRARAADDYTIVVMAERHDRTLEFLESFRQEQMG